MATPCICSSERRLESCSMSAPECAKSWAAPPAARYCSMKPAAAAPLDTMRIACGGVVVKVPGGARPGDGDGVLGAAAVVLAHQRESVAVDAGLVRVREGQLHAGRIGAALVGVEPRHRSDLADDDRRRMRPLSDGNGNAGNGDPQEPVHLPHIASPTMLQ